MKITEKSFKEKSVSFLKSHLLVICCFLICFTLYFFSYNNKNISEEYTSFSNEQTAETKEPAKITVYVTGEVKNPGLYKLNTNSRASDAIEAAGGFTKRADDESINIAKILKDGDQVNVPANKDITSKFNMFPKKRKTKSVSQSNPSAEGATENNSVSETSSEPDVNLNCLNKTEYMTVEGVTNEIAENIINHINTYGDFKSVDELMLVEGIDASLYNSIKDKFTV